MPLANELWKAYGTYYTHSYRESSAKVGFLRRVYRGVGKRRWEKKVRMVYGPPQGRLLDVGCGAGEGLLFLREMGWQVQGVDFDENAVNAARKMRLDVQRGSLKEQSFPDGTFDVVNLSHVIEHLPDPIETLAECRRILKRGGKLVLFTPNSSSLGHRIFKGDWRGLEPPRHLHIFSAKSMRLALIAAGFHDLRIYPQTALSINYESILLRLSPGRTCNRARRNWTAWVFAQLLAIMETAIQKRKPELIECLVAVATKE